MALSSHLEKVAIIGFGGNIGKVITEALVKTGKHTVTALSRAESKAEAPEGVRKVTIDYDNESSIESALQGQQALIITLAFTVPLEVQGRIARAAAKAGVRWIMPNGWGIDTFNKQLITDVRGPEAATMYDEIERAGVPYTALVCGFWYHYSLALGENCFGIDIPGRTAHMMDDGLTETNTTTWSQVGRAVAAFLSLPETRSAADDGPSLNDWRNKALQISSFRVTQRSMLDSVQKATGTTDADWKLEYIPAKTKFENIRAEQAKGGPPDMGLHQRAFYARVFFPNGDGLYETKGLANETLGLPVEDMDQATNEAVEMAGKGWNPYI